MFSAFGKLISVPFAALLRWFYTITGSYGLALILFSLVVKLVILPFQMKSKRSMVRMGRLSSKQAELQKKYANNQQKYQEELAKLYQEAGVNPMGGCLWSFLPMFIIIPLYSIIRQPITYFMGLGEDVLTKVRDIAIGLGYEAHTLASGAYDAYEQIGLAHFISQPQNWDHFQGTEGLIQMNYSFLGVDLSSQPQAAITGFQFTWPVIGLILIPVLAAALQYLTTIIMTKSNGQTAQPGMKMMNLLMPLMSLWFCFIMPASLGIYWICNSVFAMIQEWFLGKFYNKKLNDEEDEREAKRLAARQLRVEEAKKKAAEIKEQEAAGVKRIKKQPQRNAEKGASTTEAGRVGDRPYARGRSYVEDRYKED